MAKRPIPPKYDHQVKSIDRFLLEPHGLDTSDPGTGKTRVQIDLFAQRRAKGGKCALVLALKSLVRSAWEEDFLKFAPHLTTSVALAPRREKGFAVPADVYITNVDAAKWLARQPKSFFDRFDTLIIDELTAFKHHSSQRSRAIAKIAKHFKYRYGLTGTPNANKLTDIWHQAFIIDGGRILGRSFYQFRNSVCVPQQVGPQPNMVEWMPRPGSEEAVAAMLAPITVRNVFEECVDIPPNLLYSVPFHLTPRQRKAYEQMKRHSMAVLDNSMTVSAPNAAVVMGKLLQIASGATYVDEHNLLGEFDIQKAAVKAVGFSPIDSARTELVVDLVEARDHSIVFFHWTHQRDCLIEELKKRGVTYALIDGSVPDRVRSQIVKDFQAGFYKVLLAHPKSAAHGLTLTRATSTIWASPTSNLELFMQGNKRIYRAGQTLKTETIVVIAPDTIEETVYKKMTAKQARQESLLSVLRDHFNES